jgi:hypothetical protein
LEAVGYYKYLKADAGRSYAHVSEHFGVSRARVSQFVGIITRLPERFIVSMKKCEDPDLLKTFCGKELIRISRLPSPEQREEEINRLVTQFQYGPIERMREQPETTERLSI